VLALVDRLRPPSHVFDRRRRNRSLRYKELNTLLPILSARELHVQLVTSAVREIPAEMARSEAVCRSSCPIDGLQPEHERAGARPATYDRILKHIAGHEITVALHHHQASRSTAPVYLEEFLKFLVAGAKRVAKIWMSLYTPQIGELSEERLRPIDREARRRRSAGAPPALPEAGAAEGADSRCMPTRPIRPTIASSRGRRRTVSADFQDADHAMPVRRRPRLQQLRVHCLGPGWRRSRAINCSGSFRSPRFFAGSLKVGGAAPPGCARQSRPPPDVIIFSLSFSSVSRKARSLREFCSWAR